MNEFTGHMLFHHFVSQISLNFLLSSSFEKSCFKYKKLHLFLCRCLSGPPLFYITVGGHRSPWIICKGCSASSDLVQCTREFKECYLIIFHKVYPPFDVHHVQSCSENKWQNDLPCLAFQVLMYNQGMSQMNICVSQIIVLWGNENISQN